MARLGTYTTFDYPTKQGGKAYIFLQNAFGKIGGKVRKINNPHDFCMYPSFEIDYPAEIADIDSDDYLDEDEQLIIDKDNWHDKADKIYTEYNETFEKYL